MLKQSNNYLKYSGIGLQLLVIVVGGTYAGFWIDEHYNNQKPVFSITFGFTSVVIGIFYLVRQLLKKDN
ncbi:MAG: AtpZ/AtpI family protein [Opitutaceae bacterium]|nr:AtpZ/AtpI family protein [Cytophagales bacterium]